MKSQENNTRQLKVVGKRGVSIRWEGTRRGTHSLNGKLADNEPSADLAWGWSVNSTGKELKCGGWNRMRWSKQPAKSWKKAGRYIARRGGKKKRGGE